MSLAARRARPRALRVAFVLGVGASVVASMSGCKGCKASPPTTINDLDARSPLALLADSGPKPGAPRPGMIYVPAGILRAGTPEDRLPRIATEEMPGTPVQMGAFYIDIFPYPNEPGAIPQPNVARDEAIKLCEEKGKRLCTELEWERACKGPDNTTYEYGDAYRASACLTGQAIELSSRKPCGERAGCRSGFGVLEMHGGAWEWTSSPWGRGTHDPTLGVLRGGNAQAGEIVGRCANAIGRPVSKKQPTFGFRCCAGEKNAAEVSLEQHSIGKTIQLLQKPEERAAPFLSRVEAGPWGGDVSHLEVDRAWTWQPVANEDLLVFGACTPEGPARKCGFVVGRTSAIDGSPQVLGQALFPRAMPEMKTSGEPAKIHARAMDFKGPYYVEFSYSYGKVSVSEPIRLPP